MSRPFERAAVVFNGAKSARRLRAFEAAARERLGLPASALSAYVSTSGPDVGVQARRAVDEGHDLVLAGGGDGTLWQVLRATRGSGVALGVLPFGTSNDCAHTLGMPRDADAIEALANGRRRPVDVATCRFVGEDGREAEDVLCTSGGLGFTARITQVERGRLVDAIKRFFGQPGWVPVCAGLALTTPGVRVDLALDGRPHTTRAALVELGKVTSIGGMPLLPRARLDGGYFDLCAFDGSLPRRMRLLASLQVSRGHVGWPDFQYFCDEPSLNPLGLAGVREVEVVPAEPMPLHLHGEFVGFGPARFRLAGETVDFLAPAAS